MILRAIVLHYHITPSANNVIVNSCIDNLGLIKRLQHGLEFSISHTQQPNSDLICEIHNTISELPFSVEWRHVKSHQCDNEDNLLNMPLPHRVNKMCDVSTELAHASPNVMSHLRLLNTCLLPMPPHSGKTLVTLTMLETLSNLPTATTFYFHTCWRKLYGQTMNMNQCNGTFSDLLSFTLPPHDNLKHTLNSNTSYQLPMRHCTIEILHMITDAQGADKEMKTGNTHFDALPLLLIGKLNNYPICAEVSCLVNCLCCCIDEI